MIKGTVWTGRGPSPIADNALSSNGMTTAIAVHPSDSDLIYMGTAGGGVWKTFDGGATWRPLFDRQPALGIGEPSSIAIDPNDTDIIYVGTSGRGRVSPQVGQGLFKSTNAGATWIQLGSEYPAGNTGNAIDFVGRQINTVIVEPTDSDVVYMAASNGVWRSDDGGFNWTQATGSGGDARSLVLDATSPAGSRRLYAGVSGTGVIGSTDGAQTFTQLLNATTPAVAAALAAVAGTTINQVVVDLAPPTAPPNAAGIQVMYVAIANGNQGATPDPVGLFMTVDQGANWTQQAAAGGPGTTFNGYCMTIAVDPASPGDGVGDILYYGTQNQRRSTDSGASFSALTNLHADTHAWAFVPQPAGTPTVVFCGNDGGISRSDDDGASWIPLNAGALQTALFYNLDIKPDAGASATVGALQDNRLEQNTGGLGWNTMIGGDGWDIVYDGAVVDQLFATTNSGATPMTRVFRSVDDGSNWTDVTPWPNVAPENGFYLSSLAADPGNGGVIYAASNQNLWQTLTGGNNWRSLVPIASGFITANVSVAPTNGNNVVVANATQVLVSTNAFAPTVGGVGGVAFTNITRNLPARNVLRVKFDPNDSNIIYAVLGGFSLTPDGVPSQHVFRTTVGGTAWTDISPPVDGPYGALVLDGEDTPTSIYVGTEFGVIRSVDGGDSWYVLDDLHFPRCPVTDLEIGRGSQVMRAATYGRGVFEFVRPDWPSIAIDPEAGFDFGIRCLGLQYLTLDVFNVGQSDLTINSVQRVMGSTAFRVLDRPGTPAIVAPGSHITFTVAFDPTQPGVAEEATIRIQSDDPAAPIVDIQVTGALGQATLETAIADGGQFGQVCVGELVDRDLVFNNRGPCDLEITSILSSDAAFEVPGVTSYPLVVAAGVSLTVPIRYRPPAVGSHAAVITILSNDPDSPDTVDVFGEAPPPRLVASVPDQGAFGDVCLGEFRDQMLTLANAGFCPLTITAITSSSPDFVVPDVQAFPIVIAGGGDAEVMIRFEPHDLGPSSGTITIHSDDPASPTVIDVSGNTPSGKLTITGTTDFGPSEFGKRSLLTISICNTGCCPLHIKHVGFAPPCPCDEHRRKPCGCGQCNCCRPCNCGECEECKKKRNDQCCTNFRIVTNPFPAKLHPGSCLDLLLEYTPTCDSAACCELVIESDDPDNPEQRLFVTGHLRRTLRSALKCWAAQELHDILKSGNC